MSDDMSTSAMHGPDAWPFGAPDGRPGLLVVADMLSLPDLQPVADAAGLRLLDVVTVEAAADRLDRQIGCDCALLFCDRASDGVQRLLVQAETLAIQNAMGLIVVTTRHSLDLAFACLRGDEAHLLCEPEAPDLAGALIALTRGRPVTPTFHDIAGEGESQRLQQLSEQVGRIARTLEALTRAQPSLSSAWSAPHMADKAESYQAMPALSPIGGEAPKTELTAGRVRDVIRARRLRAELLPGDLFADPAWDMLLDLLAARLDHERVSVSSLCIASDVPPTTALRWIRTLTERGLVLRQADPHDGRRVFIGLADSTVSALTQWFAAGRRYLCG